MLELFRSRDKIVFNRILIKGLVGLLAFLFILLFVKEYFGTPWIGGWGSHVAMMISFASFIGALALYKSTTESDKKKPDSMSKFFFWGIRVIIVILLGLGAFGVMMVFETSAGDGAVFKAIALGIVTLWACIFLSYFIWAVYYYNINMGLTDEEWNKIYQAKEDKRQGNFYNEDDIEAEPESNPYKDETFGMPNGTVRGMIAFSLLFGAIALLVASFGMTNEIDSSSLFWDQYEFFKTAFLMMIAFYFGSRSLQYLRPNGAPVPVGKNGGSPASQPSQTSMADQVKREMDEPSSIGADDPMKVTTEESPKEEKPTKEDFAAVDPMKG
ncbi:MAG: hypothetical protein RLN88_13135 [Ekhidna sp.]|uniref:hypothetical protein n=1 Tax=Ekhidna sp. TaxID=2608089 RepID=UPI0032EF33B7